MVVRMEVGDVVMFKPSSPISFVIAYLTKSEYSHVGLVVGKDMVVEADRFVNTRLSQIEFDPNRHALYRVPGLLETQKKIIQEYAVSMIGTRYDYWQIFGWFIRLVFGWNKHNLFNRSNYLICSELIDQAYQRAGVPRSCDCPVGDVTPQDLLRIYNFVRVA